MDSKNYERFIMQVTKSVLISVWKCTKSVWPRPDPLGELGIRTKAPRTKSPRTASLRTKAHEDISPQG